MKAGLVLRLAVMLAALTTRHPSAQVPTIESLRTGTAAISGRVFDARSGEPLSNVTVLLTAPKIMGATQTRTDDAGTYQFSGLAEHDYNVIVMDPLYERNCYGATDPLQPGCGAVSLQRNQQRTGIDFRLTRTAILRGRVLDDAGQPVAGAIVSAQPAPSAAPVGWASGMPTTKHDGSFELSLPGGDWLLSLDMPVTADKPRPPAVFYPGVIGMQDTEVIRLGAGLVTSGITFRYPKVARRSLTARISTPAAGATAIRAWLYRVEPRMMRAIALDADGSGSVEGLLEGRYYVVAEAEGDGQPLAAFAVAEVLDDAVEVALLLQEPGRIAGRVVADKGGVPPLADVRVAARWTDDGEDINPLATDDVAVGADGSFLIEGLFGLRQIQLLGLLPGWQVQSIRQGRSEVTTTGVDVANGATLGVVITVGRR